MPARWSKNAIVTDMSNSEDEVIQLKRRRINRICSSSSSSENDELNDFESEDNIDEHLEELILEEKEEINNDDQSGLDPMERVLRETFPFAGGSGLLKDLSNNTCPVKIFFLFIDRRIINLLVTKTNRYAQQKIQQY